MYADDVCLFTKANKKSLRFINNILEEFSQFSGLEVNKTKSSATFSKVCEGNLELQNILGF